MITYAELTDKHSFLTNKEYLSRHGGLSLDRIEALIEMEDAVREQEGALNYIDEAGGRLPRQGFLQDTINNLQALSERLLGTVKDDLIGIIKQVEELQTYTTDVSEYGLEQLKAAKDLIYGPCQNHHQ